MPVDLSIQGAAELAAVGRELKRTGNGDLRKELFAGLNRATKPLKSDVKRSALSTLPQRGGLSRLIAKSKLTTTKRMSGRNVGVRITGKLSGHDLRSIDSGRVRHPVFGRDVWVTQEIVPGFFTKPLEAGEDEVRREVLDVLEDVAVKLVRAR